MNKKTRIKKGFSSYIFTIFFVALFFVINIYFFGEKEITTEKDIFNDCLSDNTNDPSTLSDERPVYHLSGEIKENESEYNRLSFNLWADMETSLVIRLSSAFGKEFDLKRIKTGDSFGEKIEEIAFAMNQPFTDLIFEKENKKDHANIFIKNVKIKGLNISNKKEFSALKPTINPIVETNEIIQAQTSDSTKTFHELGEKKVLLGQVFKANGEYISGIELIVDLNQIEREKDEEYMLQLREAEFDGVTAEIGKKVIIEKPIRISEIDRSHSGERKIKVFIFAKVEQDNHYFIGIDNDRADTSKFNHLALKGSPNQAAYADGTACLKHKSETYPVAGDLHFVIYGGDFERYNGAKVLFGSKFQDIGKGEGNYEYRARGTNVDLVNIFQSSKDISFNEDKGVVYGKNRENKESFIVYKFETIYPFKSFNLKASQASASWNKVKILYSYDEQQWNEIPFSNTIEESIPKHYNVESQSFDYSEEKVPSSKNFFIKIIPDKDFHSKQKKFYGIKDLELDFNLDIK